MFVKCLCKEFATRIFFEVFVKCLCKEFAARMVS